MIGLPTALAFSFYEALIDGKYPNERYGNIVCSIDNVDMATNVNFKWDEWNQSDPVKVFLQGELRTVQISAIYQPHDAWSPSGANIVLEVDFWVGDADNNNREKWNYMRKYLYWVQGPSNHFDDYVGIAETENNVLDTEVDHPGEYKCRNVMTEFPLPEAEWPEGPEIFLQ